MRIPRPAAAALAACAATLALTACHSSGTATAHATLDPAERTALAHVEHRAQTCEPMFSLAHPIASTRHQVIPCFATLVPAAQRQAFASYAFVTALKGHVWHTRNRPAWYNLLAVKITALTGGTH